MGGMSVDINWDESDEQHEQALAFGDLQFLLFSNQLPHSMTCHLNIIISGRSGRMEW